MKIPSKHSILACAVGAVFIASASAASAATPGAWETFFSQERVDAWTVYDYSDDELYFAEWDPMQEVAFLRHEGDAPLWFFVGPDPGGEAFVGNYTTANIGAIAADVFIESLAGFDEVDCAILASGPNGPRYYYSFSYAREDFSAAGWHSLRFGLDTTWYLYDGVQYLPVQLTSAILSSVQEIGFRFFPTIGSTADNVAAIDDILLEPEIFEPRLTVTTTGGQFRLSFPKAPTHGYAIQQLVEPGLTWQDVGGQVDITGAGTHVFTRALTAPRGIFRVEAYGWYTPLENP